MVESAEWGGQRRCLTLARRHLRYLLILGPGLRWHQPAFAFKISRLKKQSTFLVLQNTLFDQPPPTPPMVKPYIYKVGPESKVRIPLGVVDTFWDFINTFSYTRRERDIAFGILSVMVLAMILLFCACKIDRDEQRYIKKLQAKARKRGLKVD